MAVQVSFHNEKLVKCLNVPQNNIKIVNRIEYLNSWDVFEANILSALSIGKRGIKRGIFFDGEIARNRMADPLTLESSKRLQYSVGAECE